MIFTKKEKPIKLGQIKNDKVEKMSDSVTWNLDYTICVFIRDSLKRFKEKKDSFPAILLETMSEEEAIEHYDKIIDTIIDRLDFYLMPTEQLISDGTKAAFNQFFDAAIDPFEAAENQDFINAQKNVSDIYQDQLKSLYDAFDMLKTWLPSFWW